MMKKIVSVLIVLIFAAVLLTTGAYAIGEIVGSAVCTDIAAYINNYPISSYNIDGYTAVVAEDLSEYGFTVVWDGSARTLSITADESAKTVTATKTVKKSQTRKIGEKAHDVYNTDIVTYVNGKEVVGRNIGGYTIIYFEDLSPFGECRYDNSERALFLDMERLPKKEFVPVETEKNPVTSVNATVAVTADVTISGSAFKVGSTMYMNISSKTGVVEANVDAVIGGQVVNMTVYVDTKESMMYLTEDGVMWEKLPVENVTFTGLDYDDTLYPGASMNTNVDKELAKVLTVMGINAKVENSEVNVTINETNVADDITVPQNIKDIAVTR